MLIDVLNCDSNHLTMVVRTDIVLSLLRFNSEENDTIVM